MLKNIIKQAFIKEHTHKNNELLTDKYKYLLIISQFLIIAPFFTHIPLWIYLIFILASCWQVKLKVTPGIFLQIIMISLIWLAARASTGNFRSLNSFAIVLISMFILKLWEISNKRDVLVIVWSGFICIAVSYLFENDLWFSIYSILPIFCLLTLLMFSNIANNQFFNLQFAFNKISKTFLLALPFILVLFVLTPRISPLWGMPSSNEAKTTGLQDSLNANAFADLTRSKNDLTFRATFQEKIPERNLLYWRAFTLDYFDGEQWSRSNRYGFMRNIDYQAQIINKNKNNQFTYSVLMQANAQNNVFSLDIPIANNENLIFSPDFNLSRINPFSSSFLYEATSDLKAKIINKPRFGNLLNLPLNNNEKSKAFARALKEEFPKTEDFIQALLTRFNQEFTYTLQVNELSKNGIDDFLFETKRGFCSHFASATTFLLRSVGIPSRVVLGYQGGEINNDKKYVEVFSSDAHAWLEYYDENLGWIKIDPTFAVAPERIENGFLNSIAENERDLVVTSFLKNSSFPLFTKLDIFLSDLNYNWQKFVISYQQNEQNQLFANIFKSIDFKEILIYLILSCLLLFILISLLMMKPFKKQSQLVKIYNQFLKIALQQNVKSNNLTVNQIAMQLTFDDRKQIILQKFIKQYNEFFYAKQGDIKEIKQLLKELQ